MAKSQEDRLEKFIIDHRSEFDHDDPPQEIWERISREVKAVENKEKIRGLNTFGWVWKVAAVVFFVMTVYLSVDKFSQLESNSLVVSNDSGFDEFLNAEQYYNGIIEVKQQELNKALPKETDLNFDFNKDVAELDSMYLLLKEDFKFNNDEHVIDAMIFNLRLRIEILDRQLQIIKNLNTLEERKNEGINT